MGCSCGKKKRKPVPTSTSQPPSPTASYELIYDTGRVQTYGSKLEADAANALIGYTGTVKPA